MKEVLIVSIGFSPNIGGIETHFDDLTKALDHRGWKVWVLTYKPITTEVNAPVFEKRGKNIFIYRIPWFGNIFYKLVKRPIAEFFYLFPGLFIFLPILLLARGRNIRVIHSHGLIAGFVSVFWGKLFGKRIITTTHSIYSFLKSGGYRDFAKWIFSKSDLVLTLSKQSAREIEVLGIPRTQIKVFTYWVDLRVFNRMSTAKKDLGWANKFVVLFVGRLVAEKGIGELLKASKIWDKKITLVIIGNGPMEPDVNGIKRNNLIYLGKVENSELPLYYSSADMLIAPSTSEEGFGRVILESLACGTPVIGSRRGAIPEAMNDSVGKLIDVSPVNIKRIVEYFYKNPTKLNELSRKCRKFALERYSEDNVKTIIDAYEI